MKVVTKDGWPELTIMGLRGRNRLLFLLTPVGESTLNINSEDDLWFPIT